MLPQQGFFGTRRCLGNERVQGTPRSHSSERCLRIHTLRDVRTLDREVIIDKKRIRMEHIIRIRVADPTHRISDDLAHIEHLIDRLRRALLFILKLWDSDLTTHYHHIAFHKRLTGHTALRINRKAGIKDRIRDRIGDFVRMAFANRLGGKNVGAHIVWRFSYRQIVIR